jgi:flagellar biosynthesis protein FlhG
MPDQASRLRNLADVHRRPKRDAFPHVITVTSGKGGVGKSTVALNLAIAMADKGVRVLLLDADANLGSIDIMLGVSPRFRLSHVLRGEQEIEDVLLTPYHNLRVVPGSSGDADYPVLHEQRQRELMTALRELEEWYDVLLVDTAAGMTPEILGYCALADDVLVVTGVEPTAIMDAYAMVKALSMRNPTLPVQIVLNAVRVPREGEEAVEKLQRAIKHFLRRDVDCVGAIPYDPAVQRAILDQKPIMRSAPRSAASLCIHAIARELLEVRIRSSLRKAGNL